MLLRMWQIFHILCIVWTNAEIVFLEAYSSKNNTPLKTRRFYAKHCVRRKLSFRSLLKCQQMPKLSLHVGSSFCPLGSAFKKTCTQEWRIWQSQPWHYLNFVWAKSKPGGLWHWIICSTLPVQADVTERQQGSSALMKASLTFSQIFPEAFCICWAKE